MSLDEEFVIVSDDDGHHYIIPADKLNDWDIWICSEDYELGQIPEWAVTIGGSPTLVKFKKYRIE